SASALFPYTTLFRSYGLIRVAEPLEDRASIADRIHAPRDLVRDEPLQEYVALLSGRRTARAVIDQNPRAERLRDVLHEFVLVLQDADVLGARAHVRLTDDRQFRFVCEPQRLTLALESPRLRHPLAPPEKLRALVFVH